MNFSLRKTTSLTALMAFITLTVTGIVLYLVPQGRVAYWSEWRLWGATKENWAAFHILLSLLFLIAGLVHIVLNWRPIVFYLKDRGRRLRVVTPDFLVALGLTLAFSIGSLAGWVPFRWVMDMNTQLKDQASRTLGEPPYGHAEQSSLKVFSERVGLELPKALALLEAKSLQVAGPEDRIQDIAKRNHITPQQVFSVIKAAEKPRPSLAPGRLPEEAAPGLGRKTLSELCREYQLDEVKVAKVLQGKGLTLAFDQPFRALAEAHGMGPHDLYATLRDELRKP